MWNFFHGKFHIIFVDNVEKTGTSYFFAFFFVDKFVDIVDSRLL